MASFSKSFIEISPMASSRMKRLSSSKTFNDLLEELTSDFGLFETSKNFPL